MVGRWPASTVDSSPLQTCPPALFAREEVQSRGDSEVVDLETKFRREVLEAVKGLGRAWQGPAIVRLEGSWQIGDRRLRIEVQDTHDATR
jgi:hypothetical protein